ncbi:hypothetical protein ILUMI_04634 [Ignelater luminosus]|uniref:TIL domain-containing protein n=1 Tax=Ignelater luminosus TaxID=2038154 RepID=A0A8K0DCH5_IGNLU|nr:hypothetical protein ILUMI_04634 [Ignelater luminosus]
MCVPACECKKGYIWDEISKKCILEKQCPPYVCGVNEEWRNCSDRHCRRSCQNLGKDIIPCSLVCLPGCDCKAGYIWDEDIQKCIPKNRCPKQCPPNEVYNCKKKHCELSCQNKNQSSSLQCYTKPPNCICEAGFFRDEVSGKCVSLKECPKICGINEEWRNCSDKYCRRTCQNRGQFLSCPYVCKPGCSCKKGFIWDENSSLCIPENLCPEVCGINEEWRECSDIYCRRTCQNKGQILNCPKICKSGCSCKKGFIWDENSKLCVPEYLCPVECAANEIENCDGVYCEPTCQEQSSSFKCYSQPKKCICQTGFLRDLVSGKCVFPVQCPKVCKNNEEWDNCTNPICKRTCQNRFRTDIFCPTVCVAGCRCKNGFIWDEISKTCIPEYLCPVNECGINEVWANCSDKYCRRSCQNMNKILNCPRIICQPGCVCKPGFIWNEEINQCVPQWQCPNICGKNEIWKKCSDVTCRETCERKRSKVCLEACIPGCSCKDGYIWNENLQKCVDKCESFKGIC